MNNGVSEGEQCQWWAVHTLPLKEGFAYRHLKRAKIHTYFPHSLHWVGKDARRSRLVTKPTLNRYLFVNCPQAFLGMVAQTYGVWRVLAFDGVPVPIPDGTMRELMVALGETPKTYTCAMDRKRRFNGKAGTRFMLKEGSSFWGFVAEVKAILDNGRIKAKLLGDLFGAVGREIDVPLADVGEILLEGQPHASP